MKNKLKTLISAGVAVGQMLSSGVALAAGPDINSAPMPVGEQGPEIYIKQIAPDEQKILLYYQDQGGRENARFTNFNVVWPRDADELKAERPFLGDDYVFDFDALAMDLGYANQWWAGAHNNGNFTLTSESETEIPAKWPDVYALSDSPYNVLYLSVQLTDGVEQKYWVGKADYSDCMRYYQPGVVCEGVVQDDLSVKYLPFLDGKEIEMTEENGTSEDDSENGDGDGGSGDDTDEENSAVIPTVPIDTLMVPTAPVSAESAQPVLLAGVGSAVIDSGSASQGGQWTGVDDESVEDADDETTDDADVATLRLPTTETAVPELGGEDQSNYWLLVLGALAVAAGALMLWWWVILPLVKRKKEEEESRE